MGNTSNGPKRRFVTDAGAGAAPDPDPEPAAGAAGASDVPAQAVSSHGATPRVAALVSSWRRWILRTSCVFISRSSDCPYFPSVLETAVIPFAALDQPA